jgi:hypothetical protein
VPCVWECIGGDHDGVDFARRAARNEEIVRDVNRQIEEGAHLHEVGSEMPFHCECGKALCLEKIELRARIYEPILAERYRFVVVPDHVVPEVERVVEEHGSFVVVEKVGEARDQIDRDHPQELHAAPNAQTMRSFQRD